MSTMSIEVGSALRSREEFTSLPVGSVIRGSRTWTKGADEIWTSDEGRTKPSDGFSLGVLRLVSVPDDQIGRSITSADEYAALPVGSQVRGTHLWEKQSDGRWSRVDNPAEYAGSLSTAGDIVVVTLIPAVVYPFAVDDGLDDISEFDHLPAGTIIGPHWSEAYLKESNTRYVGCDADGRPTTTTASNPHSGSFSRGGYNKILRIPGVAVPIQQETLLQFKWKFRDYALQATERNSIRRELVTAVLDELDCGPDQFVLGSGVKVENNGDRSNLPDGSVIYIGNPAHLAGFGLFAKQSGNWIHMLGHRIYIEYNSTTIDTLPGGQENRPDWTTAVGTEEDERLIRQFKARAWRVGEKAKRAHSWCSEFESMMSRLNITAESVVAGVMWNGIRIGDTVNVEQAATLPVGSILKWVSTEDPARYCYYKRVAEGSSNAAQTLRVFGNNPSGGTMGHYNSTMQVEWVNDERFGDMNVLLPQRADLFDVLPVGSVFLYNSGTRYQIARDHKAYEIAREGALPEVRDVGRHAYTDYGTNPRLHLVGLP